MDFEQQQEIIDKIQALFFSPSGADTNQEVEKILRQIEDKTVADDILDTSIIGVKANQASRRKYIVNKILYNNKLTIGKQELLVLAVAELPLTSALEKLAPDLKIDPQKIVTTVTGDKDLAEQAKTFKSVQAQLDSYYTTKYQDEKIKPFYGILSKAPVNELDEISKKIDEFILNATKNLGENINITPEIQSFLTRYKLDLPLQNITTVADALQYLYNISLVAKGVVTNASAQPKMTDEDLIKTLAQWLYFNEANQPPPVYS